VNTCFAKGGCRGVGGRGEGSGGSGDDGRGEGGVEEVEEVLEKVKDVLCGRISIQRDAVKGYECLYYCELYECNVRIQ
jgi:hypothetical protein